VTFHVTEISLCGGRFCAFLIPDNIRCNTVR